MTDPRHTPFVPGVETSDQKHKKGIIQEIQYILYIDIIH